ncbi:MAG: hypothetical protein WBP18_03760 [Paracoccaceae bacterium]
MARANAALAEGRTLPETRAMLQTDLPPSRLYPRALQVTGAAHLHVSIRAENAHERDNIDKVLATMAEVLKTPDGRGRCCRAR